MHNGSAAWLDGAVVGCRCHASAGAAGTGVVLAGLGLVGLGLWARRDVRRGLERERIVAPGGGPVSTASAARALAEMIRDETVAAAEGRTYAETDQFLGADGTTTSDRDTALVDERTGQPLPNPSYELWISSTTLQTALMQAYMAFRISDLMLGIGGALVLSGAGIAASARR